jgi:hypothetical protein
VTKATALSYFQDAETGSDVLEVLELLVSEFSKQPVNQPEV